MKDVEINEELPMDPAEVAEALERAHEDSDSLDLPEEVWFWLQRED